MRKVLFTSGLYIISLLCGIHSAFACGGVGPCAGTQGGKHGHAHLIVYDANKSVIEIPNNIGRTEAMKPDGQTSFCYTAVHTHDLSGTLHLVLGKGNDLTLKSFLSKWNPDLLKGKVTVSGKKIKNPNSLRIKSGMHIEIAL
ncbi:MAG: hypothetical protein Q8R30_03195 [bacterium]|nr:hypothetical protein [bacterium]MDZ4285767.1 hypothetical protein [Candidatus Sungbacteria bacterium]